MVQLRVSGKYFKSHVSKTLNQPRFQYAYNRRKIDAVDGQQRCLDLNPTNLAANELLQELLQLGEMVDSLVRSMINCELTHASHSIQNTNKSRSINIRPLVFGSDIHSAGERGPSRSPVHSVMAKRFIDIEDEIEDKKLDYEGFRNDDEGEVEEEIEEICSKNEEEGE
jgi:hypothetical protein